MKIFDDLYFYRISLIPEADLLEEKVARMLAGDPLPLVSIEDAIREHIHQHTDAFERSSYEAYISIEKLIDNAMSRIICNRIPRTKGWFEQMARYVDSVSPKYAALYRLCKEGKGILDEPTRQGYIDEYAVIFPELLEDD